MTLSSNNIVLVTSFDLFYFLLTIMETDREKDGPGVLTGYHYLGGVYLREATLLTAGYQRAGGMCMKAEDLVRVVDEKPLNPV